MINVCSLVLKKTFKTLPVRIVYIILCYLFRFATIYDFIMNTHENLDIIIKQWVSLITNCFNPFVSFKDSDLFLRKKEVTSRRVRN